MDTVSHRDATRWYWCYRLLLVGNHLSDVLCDENVTMLPIRKTPRQRCVIHARATRCDVTHEGMCEPCLVHGTELGSLWLEAAFSSNFSRREYVSSSAASDGFVRFAVVQSVSMERHCKLRFVTIMFLFSGGFGFGFGFVMLPWGALSTDWNGSAIS